MVARIKIMGTKINKRRKDYEKKLATLMIEVYLLKSAGNETRGKTKHSIYKFLILDNPIYFIDFPGVARHCLL